MPTFEQKFFQYLNNLERKFLAAPLVLGGVASPSGGTPGRPGGFRGYLPQGRVAYDTAELATSATPGSPALIDNLNHIRYRLQVLESASGVGEGSVVVKEGDIIVASGITVLDFNSGFGVTQSPTGEVNITVTASGASGESNTGSNVNVAGVGVYKQKSGVTLQFKGINAGSSKITVVDDTSNNEIDVDIGTLNLDHLADVVAPTPVSGEYLKYIGNNWIPATVSGGGGGATVLNDLTDVDTSGVTDGQALAYDSGTSKWVPTTVSGMGGGAFSGAVLTKSSTQSVNQSTRTAITFDGEAYDTDNYHDNVTNNSRLTATVSGWYMAGGSAELSDAQNGTWLIGWIRKNGSHEDGEGRARISSGATTPLGVYYSRIVNLKVNDYVELVIEHGKSGGATVRDTNNGTSFWIYKL